MIADLNESKTLIKHISCNCRCKFNGRKCNSKLTWNIRNCQYESKNPMQHRFCKEDNTWNSSICTYKCLVRFVRLMNI